jgi:hypothetical protein
VGGGEVLALEPRKDKKMKNFYIANANGDWWQVSDEEDATLWVVDEATLAHAVADENPDLAEIDLGFQDKLEDTIREVGREIVLDLKGDKFAEGVRYALEYLADLYEGLDETDLWAEFMTEKEGK